MSKKAVERLPFHDKDGNIKFPVSARNGTVFILPDPKYNSTNLHGLILPDSVKARKNTGIVLSCAEKIKNKRTGKWEYGVPAGTRVYFEDSVPWNYECEDQNEGPNKGKVFNLVMCNIVDVVATQE